MPTELGAFTNLPDWLLAIIQPERVRTAMAQAILEIAAGELTAQACAISRIRLKKDRWTGIYQLTVELPNGDARRVIRMQGTLIPPDQPVPPMPADAHALGSAGWRCVLPELRLLLETLPPEAALPALPTLTDPEQARALIEQTMRAAAPTYRELRIQSCVPRVVRYKPGSRCTILYDLAYPSELADRHSWPDLVAIKTYKGSKGKNAYAGMRALWDSPLGSGDAVTIAEPLAYLPELNALVQGPIREEQTLKDLIRSAMRENTPEALADLESAMRQTARGLAALHLSGAQGGESYAWEEEFAEVRATLDQLGGAIPRLAGVAEPLLARLAALASAHAAERMVPSHSSFRPAQVLLHAGKIGFIDFDSFCQAEPALDLALFLAATKNIGLSEPHEEESNEDDAELPPATRTALLDRLDAICELFLAEYAQHAPVSRPRVALWQALDLLTLVLTCWTKIKPVRLGNTLAMIERHLRSMGLYSAVRAGDSAQKRRKSAALPKFRYIAMANAVIVGTWADELAEILGFLQAII
jgi:aminoglycoside phosphotransferase (APT) family kinase protein